MFQGYVGKFLDGYKFLYIVSELTQTKVMAQIRLIARAPLSQVFLQKHTLMTSSVWIYLAVVYQDIDPQERSPSL